MRVHEGITKASERSVWATQILFALVLAQGLLIHRELILHPLGERFENLLPFLGLGVVYLTTLLSWLDFSRTMDHAPYFYGTRWERIRFLVDVGIVVSYAYLLFAVDYLKKSLSADIFPYLFGFSIVYFGYLISGLLRIHLYGTVASRQKAIILFLVLFLGLLLSYRSWYALIGGGSWLNSVFVLSAGLLVLLYRAYRRLLANRFSIKRNQGLRVGIDVDGVLGNQIIGILPMIERKYQMELGYADITHWALPIKASDIACEIEAALGDEVYVRTMPIHEGARKQIRRLIGDNKIYIVTARSSDCEAWTIEWLLANRIPYDEYINSRNQPKSNHNLHLLIDDYVKNIKTFLEESKGYGILFDQPWNRDRSELAQWQGTARFTVIRDWAEIGPVIDRIRMAIAG